MSVADHPLAFLLGTWTGSGRGEYPTIDDFEYREELTFSLAGRPFVTYGQRTWHAVDDRPLHAETGYWRCPSPGTIELVLAHPTGVVEVSHGTVEGTSLHVLTTSVACSGSAKQVTALERHIEVDGDVLRYRTAMAAVGYPLTHHLAGELLRV